jgi:DNA-binding IclR family transcriptional regulator
MALGEREQTMPEVKDTKSVERVFAIFETFERERRSLSLKELAEYCEIPVSTCHALIRTMINRAYLYQGGRRKDIYPTRRLYDVAKTVLDNDPILQRMTPVLEKLRESTEETVVLGKRQKDTIVYLEVLESPQTIRYSATVGDLKPAHSTCIGKATLSTLAPDALRLYLETTGMERVTDHTITSYARLIEDLQEGKKRGYFTTNGENVPDVSAIAIPVTVNNDLFGLAVAGPSYRMAANIDRYAQLLLQAQDSLYTRGIAA